MRFVALILAATALAMVSPAAASAAGQLWWANSSSATSGIARSNLDGTAATMVVPQTVTSRVNTAIADPARSKIYWIDRSTGGSVPSLWASNLDGSNKSQLLTGPANGIPASSDTYALTLDPVAQKLYWVDSDTDSIWWARTDGSANGLLYAPSDVPGKMFETAGIAVDPDHNLIWWSNYDIFSSGTNPAIGYANLDGSGGAAAVDLGSCSSPSGRPAIEPDDSQALVVDYSSGKIYAQAELAWVTDMFIARANLDGTGCDQVVEPEEGRCRSLGLALDPETSWLYDIPVCLGMAYADLNSPVPVAMNLLGINPGSQERGPMWQFIVKAPKLASTAGTVSASGNLPGATLSCGCETENGDIITQRVYRGAATRTIRWFRDGVEIPGETGKTITAAEAGIYKAVFTANNVAGESSVTSNEVTIAASPEPGPTPSNAFTAAAAAGPSGTVATVARVPGAGKVRQVVTRVAGGKRVGVCSTPSKTATGPGRVRLACKINAATRSAQKKGSVRLRVRVTYTPTGGTSRTVTRYVTLRSLKPSYTG